MASSNFLVWNSGSVNQEDDAAYLGDAQRVGGAPLDADFPSATANKLFYQVSTMVAAIAAAMVAQGISANDSNLANLTANFLAFVANRVQSVNTTPVNVNGNTASPQLLMVSPI